MWRAALLALCASPLAAQTPCFSYDEFQEGIKQQGLSLTFSGITGNEQMLAQVYTSPDGRWISATVTLNGVACLMSGGQVHNIFTEPQGEES